MINTLQLGDCLAIMPQIPEGTASMIFADLPFGVTKNDWDKPLPLNKLWEEFWRIAKPDGAVVLPAVQPYTSELVTSQPQHFGFAWIVKWSRGTGHLNSTHRPMRAHIDVLVFYRQSPTFNPQMTQGHPSRKRTGRGAKSDNYGAYNKAPFWESDGERHPRSVVPIASLCNSQKTGHPTEKPVPFVEYFIRTYTNPGDVVLDPVMGSGTTPVACAQTGRQYIGIEVNPEYHEIAVARLEQASAPLFL